LLFVKKVARLINADPKEIIFTSGATESNNIAVKGVARFYKDKKKHVITTQTVTIDFILYEIRVNCRMFRSINVFWIL